MERYYKIVGREADDTGRGLSASTPEWRTVRDLGNRDHVVRVRLRQAINAVQTKNGLPRGRLWVRAERR